MSRHCCGPSPAEVARRDGAYRRVLVWALVINGVMFAAEIGAGLSAGSVSLQADALDFLGDTATYAVSLFVLRSSLRARTTAALVKGALMTLFGLWVLGSTLWHVAKESLPEVATMGTVGGVALLANCVVFVLLWRHRVGDSNMRSAWLCTRNDVVGNLAVLGAALGVFGTRTAWPDILVAAIMSALALQGAWAVLRHARQELGSWT